MARKTENKCVHMSQKENDKLESASGQMDRSCSQLIHDALVVAFFKPGGVEQRLAESRLEQARELVTDSVNSISSFNFLRSDAAEGAEDSVPKNPRFCRHNESRPEVLH